MARLGSGALILACLLIAAPSALASPSAAGFGPGIENYPAYDGQDTCSPYAKPGVLAFRSVVLEAYPGTGAGGIERACDIGGTSEHKEGRAWDWSVNAGIPYQKAAADSLIDWLTDEDRYGNGQAMARRVGIMYLIWNRQIWFPGSGWRTYCVQKSFGCHTPGDKSSLRHPHTDHVHFSFTWAGAKRRTTYWNKKRSLLTGATASPVSSGQWLVSANGTVAALGVPHLGSGAGKMLTKPVVGIASTRTGSGYWLVYRNGRVSAFGDARHRGGAREMGSVAGITVSPDGKGYWIFGRFGRVMSFGQVGDFGGLSATGEEVAGLTPTPTGLGYWLVTTSGRIEAFGDALHHGDGISGLATDIVSTPTGLGYWIVTSTGRVRAFGDAPDLGDLGGTPPAQEIVGIERTPTGSGYWLVGSKGKVKPFGDAPRLVSRRSFAAMLRTPPAGLSPNLFPLD